MKSIVRLVVIMLAMLPAISFAQDNKAGWPEMKAFHALMSATFHPTEEGNFAPLKEKTDSLLMAVKAWQASVIPADYKPEETKATLEKLVMKLNLLSGAVKANADNSKLKVIITDAHEIFHKIVGECKKTE
jgi:hypothetical protein